MIMVTRFCLIHNIVLRDRQAVDSEFQIECGFWQSHAL